MIGDAWVILLGWPAVALGLALALAGVVWSKPWLPVVGAILYAPFAYYMSASPAIGWLALLLPLCLLGAAWLVHRRRRTLAGLLWAVPFAAILVLVWRIWYG